MMLLFAESQQKDELGQKKLKMELIAELDMTKEGKA